MIFQGCKVKGSPDHETAAAALCLLKMQIWQIYHFTKIPYNLHHNDIIGYCPSSPDPSNCSS